MQQCSFRFNVGHLEFSQRCQNMGDIVAIENPNTLYEPSISMQSTTINPFTQVSKISPLNIQDNIQYQ